MGVVFRPSASSMGMLQNLVLGFGRVSSRNLTSQRLSAANNILKPVTHLNSAPLTLRNQQCLLFMSTEGKQDVSRNGESRQTFPLGEEFCLVLSDADIQEITGGDPELIKKVKYIQLEHDLMR